VDVLEEVGSSFGDRHCDCVSGEEGEDCRCWSDEFGLEVSTPYHVA
jgi:hypothetical protein